MITFAREPSQNYTMKGACSVIYKGEMHFFGGEEFYLGMFEEFSLGRQRMESKNGVVRWGEVYEYRYQHFTIETRRSGRMPQMTQKKTLT